MKIIIILDTKSFESFESISKFSVETCSSIAYVFKMIYNEPCRKRWSVYTNKKITTKILYVTQNTKNLTEHELDSSLLQDKKKTRSNANVFPWCKHFKLNHAICFASFCKILSNTKTRELAKVILKTTRYHRLWCLFACLLHCMC